MAQVKVKGFPIFQRTFKKIGQIIDKQTLDAIGKTVRDAIVKETRKGKSLVTRRSLAPLKRSTIDFRKRRRLHSSTSPGKSNLTFSGQMIDSLDFRTNVSKQSVRIAPFGQRRPTRPKEKRFSNKRIAQFAHDGSSNRRKRPFIPSSKLPQKLLDDIKRIIINSAKRNLA